MYCSNCGNRLNDTDRFCGKCGKKIIVQKKRKIEKPVFNKIPQALSMLQGKKINSKHILFFLICVVIVFGGFYLSKNSSNEDEHKLNRFQWIAMLSEEFGIEEQREGAAYFKDVGTDNWYYGYIQTAVEWGIIEDGVFFNGEDAATGEFIALTTMKAIGEHKLQLYIGSSEELEDKEFLKLAYKNKLIKRSQRKKEFSKEEAEEIIIKGKELSYLLWKDNSERITYTANVLELKKEGVIKYDEESSVVHIQEGEMAELDIGKIIIFEENGLKVEKKVKEIDAQGNILVSNPQMEEIVETLEISDISSISFEDIVAQYNLDERNRVTDVALLTALSDAECVFQETNTHNFNIKNEGFSFSIVAQEEELNIIISDSEGEISYELPIELNLEDYIEIEKEDTDSEIELEASFDVTDISVGGQLIWDNGIEYTCVVVDANIAKSISAKLEGKEIPLFEIEVPLGSGAVSVELQFSLVISAEGEVTIKAESPLGMNLYYDKEIGIRNIPVERSYEEPQIDVTADLEMEFATQAILKAFKVIDVLDAAVAISASASAEIMEHDIQTCVDASVIFPMVTLSVLDEDDTLLGELFDSHEWEIVSEENAKWKLKKHFESYTDSMRKSQFVDVCTYEEKKNVNVKDIGNHIGITSGIERFYGYNLPLVFVLDYAYDENNEFYLKEEGDYYLVKGSLICPECITTDIDIREGSSFVSGTGFQYVVLGIESYSNDQREKVILEGEDEQIYEITNLPAFKLDAYTGEPYYAISSAEGIYYKTVYENIELRISKNTYFTDSNGNKGDTTFEDAVNNGWFEMVTYSIGYNIHFDSDGIIDILSSLDIESNGIHEWYGSECERRIGTLD